MMARLAGYFISVIAAAMFVATAESMIPTGRMRKIAAVTGGALLLIIVIDPLLKADNVRLSLDLSGFAAEQAAQVEQMRAENEAQIAELIKAETAEYISDKASDLGVQVRADVTVSTAKEGYCYPSSVTVTGSLTQEAKAALSAYMEDVLGIPAERQVFKSG